MKHFHKSAVLLSLLALGCSQTVVDGVRAVPGDAAVAADAPADVAAGDAASPDDAAAPADTGPARWTPPAGTDPACVSGQRWTMGNNESPLMNPGETCIACHAMDRRAPQYTAAGTAYYLDHEANDCNGYTGSAPGGPRGSATVVVEDATGRMVTMNVNLAGNFFTRSALTFPLRNARVVGPTGLTAQMEGPIPHGDCNGCHTQMGTSTEMGDPAPGRVVVPL